MRQRKAKDLESRLADCSEFLIIEDMRREVNLAAECFGKKLSDDAGIYVEIGCGKGQFIITKAMKNPDAYFIGIEGQETVILRAAEKAIAAVKSAAAAGQRAILPNNLMFVNGFVNDMAALFPENRLEGIYLNFSDPWPKARHEKRRLTYHKRLLDYAYAVRPGGFMEIKTDNDDLFEFTLEEIGQASCLEICEMTRDLHGADCTYDARLVTTEYEDKFREGGHKINYVRVIVNKSNK